MSLRQTGKDEHGVLDVTVKYCTLHPWKWLAAPRKNQQHETLNNQHERILVASTIVVEITLKKISAIWVKENENSVPYLVSRAQHIYAYFYSSLMKRVLWISLTILFLYICAHVFWNALILKPFFLYDLNYIIQETCQFTCVFLNVCIYTLCI